MNLFKFSKIIELYENSDILLDVPLTSRTQIINTGSKSIAIKRDDELSFGVSGSKYRKFASLIPYLLKNNIDFLIAEGSEYSNNIVGLAQFLKEFGIEFKFILKKGRSESAVNGKILRLLTSPKDLRFLSASEWRDRTAIIDSEVSNARLNYRNPMFLPEGSFHEAAVAGSMTLAFDFNVFDYNTIYIDSATGSSFLGVYFGLCLQNYSGVLNVISLVENRDFYESIIKDFSHKKPYDGLPSPNFKLNIIGVETSRSFGSTSRKTFDNIKKLAHKYGILTDPIYTGKSIPLAIELEENKKGSESAIIVHSGGALSLLGFDFMRS